MNLPQNLKISKKKAIVGGAILLSGVLTLCAFTGVGGNSSSEGETVYRESTVERGDITVGVTETTSASLKTHSLYFEVNAEIDEVFVKAGQTVKTGEQIISVSQESINEELNDIKVEYEEAVLKLSEATLAKQEGELTAKSKYNNTINDSTNADDTYEITVEKLENSVAKLEEQQTELEEELEHLAHIKEYVKTYDDSYNSYSSAKTAYEDAKKSVSSIESQITAIKLESGEYYYYTDEYLELESDLDTAKTLYSRNKSFYEIEKSRFEKNFDEEYPDEESIEKATKEKTQSLQEVQVSIKEAKLSLDGDEAALTKEESIEKGELAETTYNLQMQSLSNNVKSKQIAVDTLQEQIDKYNGYLENRVLTSPCDGVVLSVSYDVGDSIQSGVAVVTISDSNNVYASLTVTQDDITSITLGQSSSVTMDAFEEIEFEGIVDSITTTPARSSSGTPSYTVTVKLQGDTAKIYEGMSGSATLITRQQKDVLYITSRTIYDKDGENYVKVKNEDGTIEEVKVITGFSDGRNVEITDGLTEGQTVLTESQVRAE